MKLEELKVYNLAMDLEDAGFVILRFSDEEVLNDINNLTRTLEGWIDDFENNPSPTPAGRGYRTKQFFHR